MKVLGRAMMTKYTCHSSPVWISSINAFCAVTRVGLVDLNEIGKDHKKFKKFTATDLTDVQRNLIWTELTDCIQGFIFCEDRGKIGRIPPDIVRRDEDLDTLLLDLLARDMISYSVKVPLMHERFIEILLDGAKLATQHREFVAQGCYKNLFYLCSVINKPEGTPNVRDYLLLRKILLPHEDCQTSLSPPIISHYRCSEAIYC